MGKRGKSEAQRAKKKERKAQKRKKLLASRKEVLPRAAKADERADDRDILPDWRPVPQIWRSTLTWAPSIEGLLGLAKKRGIHPHEAAVTADCPGCLVGVERPPELWTRPKIGALTTDDILARLGALGVRVDEASFAEAARRHRSAWDLARDEWLAGPRGKESVHDRDFLGLAAHELWTRWMPDKPSTEMLLEPLFEQRHTSDTWDDAELSLAFWRGLKPVLTPEMRTADCIDDLLEGSGDSFFNWSLDFAQESAAAADELGPPVATQLARALGEMLEQLTGEDEEWRYILQVNRAVIQRATGMREEVERVLLELTEQHPDKAGAFVALVDVLRTPDADEPAAIERAVALLTRAIAAMPEGEDRTELERLIDELREDLERAKHLDTPPERRAVSS